MMSESETVFMSLYTYKLVVLNERSSVFGFRNLPRPYTPPAFSVVECENALRGSLTWIPTPESDSVNGSAQSF